MITSVINFFKESHKSSPIAFWCEMVEAVFLISASAVLTFTVLDPATKIFVPMYIVGSLLGIISGVYRKAAFVIVLCTWFTTMNLIALYQLFVM